MRSHVTPAKSTLMTEGSIARHMIAFAIPLMLGHLFQQLYNTVDSLIVGNILGKHALAAVSSSSSLLQLLISLMMGVSMGAGVVISRHFGANDEKGVSDAIHTAVGFAAIAGLTMTVVGVVLSPVLLQWMGTDPDVMPNSIVYFRNYFLGISAVALYNIFMGIMNALGDSRRPLYYLLFSSALNVVLDLLFVGVFRWGVGSAATATAISQAASAILCYLHLRKPGTIYQLQLRKIRLLPHELREIVRVGLPTGIQNSVTAIANVLVQSNINSFGPDAMAACGSYSKLQGFAFLPITAFAMALTTFTSQNLGAKQYKRAREGARFGLIGAAVLAEVIGVILTVFAPALIGLFNGDPEVVRIGVSQARIESLFFCLLAFSHAVSGICRGAGKATVPMTVMLSVWCLLRIAYITVAMSLRHDIRLLFWAYPITWFISSVIFFIYYKKSDWEHSFDRQLAH